MAARDAIEAYKAAELRDAITGIPLKEMISEIWGFIAVLVVALFAMIFFPEIVLFVPKLFGYKPGS